MKLCPNCKNYNVDYTKFCKVCHYNLWKLEDYHPQNVSRQKIIKNFANYFSSDNKSKSTGFQINSTKVFISLAIFLVAASALFTLVMTTSLDGNISGAITYDKEYLGIQECPELEIYSNGMNYFILNSEKITPQEFNLAWINENCDIDKIEI